MITKSICGIVLISITTACSSVNGDDLIDQAGASITTGGIVPIPVAGGAGSGSPSTTELTYFSDAFDTFSSAVKDGSITNPETTPTNSNAILNGYVAYEDQNDNEVIIGNLTLTADFTEGVVFSVANDFAEYSQSETGEYSEASTIGITGGNLSGSGPIARTFITSTLFGDITSQSGDIAVDSHLVGTVYDNGNTLVVSGEIVGTIGDAAVENSGFFASE